MAKKKAKSYSKFSFDDLQELGLQTVVVDLFKDAAIKPSQPSLWLEESLRRGTRFSLNTEKAKSEFIIAPVLNELYEKNEDVFSVYSGYNFTVDTEKGLQGFCDFLLAKLPLTIVPDAPIIAVVEAKLNQDLSAAIPQCAAEMYAARLWNEKRKQPVQTIYGVVTTGNSWLFLRLPEGNTVEVDNKEYPLHPLPNLLGVWQYVIDTFR